MPTRGSSSSHTVLTVMARLANRREKGHGPLRALLQARLEELAETALDVAVEVGDPLGPLLATALTENDMPLSLIERLMRRCDEPAFQNTILLREVALFVTQRMWEDRTRHWSVPDRVQTATLARLARNLSTRRRAVGQRRSAVEPARSSVELARRLAESKEISDLELLADCQENLGQVLGSIEDRHGALEATVAAIKLYLELAQRDPSEARQDTLARALYALSDDLGRLERHGEALDASTRAVAIYRQLAFMRPDRFQGSLAAALLNQAVDRARTGQHSEALAATEEAVEIRTTQAHEQPDAYELSLSRALYGLGNRLSDMGRLGDALDATAEAVAIRRRLHASRPSAFAAELAHGLSTLGVRLDHVERYTEAEAVTGEAVAIYRELDARNPVSFRPTLASTLDNFGLRLSQSGHHSEAVTATRESVKIRRQLVAAERNVFVGDLASGLTNLAGRLTLAERWVEALPPVEEAARLFRELATERPEVFLPELATTLMNLGHILGGLGQADEALIVTREAVDRLCELKQRRPGLEAQLASALNHLGVDLNHLGRHQEALTAFETSVATYRTLEKGDVTGKPLDLTYPLSNLAGVRLRLGIPCEALEMFDEVLDIYREASEERGADLHLSASDIHRDRAAALDALGQTREALAANALAESLLVKVTHIDTDARRQRWARLFNDRAVFTRSLGQVHVAVDAARRALGLYRRVARSAISTAARDDLANAHGTLGVMLQEAGQLDAGLRHARRGGAMHRRQHERHPSGLRQRHMAQALINLAVVLSAYGEPCASREAVEQLTEAVALYRSLVHQEPDASRIALAAALHNRSEALMTLGRVHDAAEPAREAVTTLGTRAPTGDTTERQELTRHRSHLASVLWAKRRACRG